MVTSYHSSEMEAVRWVWLAEDQGLPLCSRSQICKNIGIRRPDSTGILSRVLSVVISVKSKSMIWMENNYIYIMERERKCFSLNHQMSDVHKILLAGYISKNKLIKKKKY